MNLSGSLKTRIYIGFAAIVALLLIGGSVSYVGLRGLAFELKRSQDIGTANAKILKLDRDVQALRLLVDRFVGSGHPSIQQEVARSYDRLRIRIADAQDSVGFEPELFDEIALHIRGHEEQFENVVQERQLREELVQNRLPSEGLAIETRMRDFADQLDTPAAQLTLARAQSAFSLAEKSFLRYFENPDNAYVADGLARLSETRNDLQSLNVTAAPDTSIVEAIDGYQRTALRAVQATRSYTFLRNVVMAGEASEIAYYSKRIRERAENQRELISQQIDARTQDINLANAVAILTAVGIAAIIAVRLALVVVPPITALTETFQLLAAGKVLHQVPAVERGDELGEMARAAKVFSDKNQETLRLLEESENLSAELRHHAQRLEATNQELDSFAYVASHDLKSPLRGIGQLASWIEEDTREVLSEESQEYLQHLQTRVAKLESLLADLLEFSRVGRMNPPSELVKTTEVMDVVVALTDNPHNVVVRWPTDLPSLNIVRPPFEQVLLNLVGNAIKHHDKQDDAFVEVGWTDRGGWVEFFVRDNGPGIEEKNFDRIFQMYQRVGRSGVDGSGMGLAIVKKQVDHFGGKIWLESAVDVGTTFFFTWPKEIEST